MYRLFSYRFLAAIMFLIMAGLAVPVDLVRDNGSDQIEYVAKKGEKNEGQEKDDFELKSEKWLEGFELILRRIESPLFVSSRRIKFVNQEGSGPDSPPPERLNRC